MATYQVTAPEPFNFSRPSEWTKWVRRFERFRVASGMDKNSEATQVNSLIYSMGDQADDILRSFNLSEEEAKKYTTVKNKFDGYFIKRRNVIFERAKFNMRKQEEGETVDSFITTLYELAEHCNYGDLREEMIRDRLVVGIRDSKLSETLQLDGELTLEKAIAQARQRETVKQQQPLLRGGPVNKATPEVPVGAVNRKPTTTKPVNSQKSQSQVKQKVIPSAACSRCGKFPSHDRQHCAARDATCHKCGKRGHFKSVCRSSVTVRGVQASKSPNDDEDHFLGTVTSEKSTNHNPWNVTLQLNSVPVKFHIDTGAEVTVINESIHKKVGSPSLYKSDQSLRGPSNHPLTVKGKFSAQFQYGTITTEQHCYVVTGLSKPLLGRPAIEQLNLLARVQAIEETLTPIQKFPNLFTGLGKLLGQYHIKLMEGSKPHSLNVPR